MAESIAKPAKPIRQRVQAHPGMTGGGVGAIVAFLWNGFGVPHGWPEMPAEVAAASAGLAGEAVGYLVSWIGKPIVPEA